MHLIESPRVDPIEALALDEALFQEVERGGPEALHFWESNQCAVIVGAFGVVERDVCLDACAIDEVPVIRRRSGGGTVVVGPGCLNYTLVLSLEARPALRHVAESYRLILSDIASALRIPGLAVRGVSDLAVEQRKVSGNAQRRGTRALLHHGTLLYAFDAAVAERYLAPPPREPAYRAGRTHSAFLTNLPAEPQVMQVAIARAFGVRAEVTEGAEGTGSHGGAEARRVTEGSMRLGAVADST